MWRAQPCGENRLCKCVIKCGSLKLGTGASHNPDATEAEKRADEKVWQIKTDHLKIERYNQDRIEAENVLNVALKMDYETMFQKKVKETELPEETLVPVKKVKKSKKAVVSDEKAE